MKNHYKFPTPRILALPVFLLLLTVFSPGRSFAQSYCPVTITTACATYNMYIHSFSTTGTTSPQITNNLQGCSSPNSYTYYGAHTASGNPGSTVNFSYTTGTTYQTNWRIWVDWDRDGVFSASESMYYQGTVNPNTTVTGSFVVPGNAIPGLTRMRVSNVYYTVTLGPTDACTTLPYGEVEDYNFQVPPVPNDAGVSAIDSPSVFVAGVRNVKARVRNYGSNQVSSVNVNWSVNGTIQTPVSYTGTLDTVGGSGTNNTQLQLGTYNFVTNTLYNIKAWTSNPNGVADTVVANDSAFAAIRSPFNGTYTIGTTGADFPTITSAVSAMRSAGVSGPVTLVLIDNVYSTATGEVFPINFLNIAGTSAINTVTLKPAATATPLITGSNPTALFLIDGTKYITIDGRQSAGDFGRNLTVENTSTASSATVITYQNDAVGCTLRNTVIRAANSLTYYTSNFLGSVVIAGTNKAIPTGNDNITIFNNYFARAQGLQYTGAIVVNGQSVTAQNDNITIDSNWFNGFLGSASSNAVIHVTGYVYGNINGNGNNFKIRGNSFFDTATVNSYAYVNMIYFEPGATSNGDTISGNFFGGNAPFAPVGTRLQFGTSGYGYIYGVYSYLVGSGSGVVITDNVFRGISFTGTANYNYLYGIYHTGGTGIIKGNTIGDLTDTSSIYLAAYACPMYSIYAATSNSLTISDNIVSNIMMTYTGTTCNYFYGIYDGGSGPVMMNNNRVRAVTNKAPYTGSTTSSNIVGIYIGGNSQDRMVSNNVIGGPSLSDSLSCTSTTGGRIMGIGSLSGVTTLVNNKVSNLFTSYQNSGAGGTSSAIVGMYTGSTAHTILNNTVENLYSRTGTGGTSGIVGIYIPGGTVTLSGDTVRNLWANSSYTGTSVNCAVAGISYSGTGLFTMTNNHVYNLYNTLTAGSQMAGVVLSNGGATTISSNVIRNLRSFGTSSSGSILGIYDASSSVNHVITNNTVHSLVSSDTAGAPVVAGIYATGSTTIIGNNSSITRNNIHSFNLPLGSSGTPGNASAYGIWVASGNWLIANNMVRVGRDTSGAMYNRPVLCRGIYLTASGAVQNRIYHNNVYVESSPATGSQLTTAFEASASPATPGFTDVRNNIFVNKSGNTGTATSNHYVVRFPTTPSNISSDFNLYHNTPSANAYVGARGATNYVTMANAQAGLLLDGSTGYDNTLALQGPTGDYTAVNLRIVPTNKAEGAGDPSLTSFVSDDFDGAARSGVSPVDIGATGGNYTLSADVHAPSITYTPLTNTIFTSDISFNAVIMDGGGVPVGADAPRVYFKKGLAGTWYSQAGTLTAGTRFNGTWAFTVTNSLMSGVAAGDTIYYFVTAQDSTAGNLNSNKMYAAGSVNTITTYPTAPGMYRIAAAFPSVVTVGSGGTYPTLTGSTGFFNAVNNSALSGNITVELTSNITEPGTVSLNGWLEAGASPSTITIRPQGNTQIMLSGTASNTTGLIRLNGASRVNILGYSATGTVSDTNLVIRSSQTSTPALGFINGGGIDTIMNVIFESRNSSTGTMYISPTSLTQGLSNVLITGCTFRQDLSAPTTYPYSGFYGTGTTPRFNSNIRLINNMFCNFSSMAIYVLTTGNGNNWTISGNHIFQNAIPTWTSTMYGIYFVPSSTSDNNVISNNWIGGTAPYAGGNALTHSGLFYGIYAQAGLAAGTTISGNVVTNMSWTAANTNTQYGIYAVGTGAVYNITGNRIGHTTSQANSINSAGNQRINGIYSTASGNVTIQNDTVVNIMNTNAGGASVGVQGIYAGSGSSNVTVIDGNYVKGLFVNSSNTGYGYANAGAVTGILLASSSLTQSITNNRVQTLVNTSTTGAYQMTGIVQYSGGGVNVNNNTVYGIYSRSAQTAVGSNTSAVMAISVYSTTSIPHYIMGNTVDSVWQIPSSANATQVVGIFNYYHSSIPMIITGNTVRNINVLSNNTGTMYNASIIGIGMYYSYQSLNANVSNNTVYNLHNLHGTSGHSIIGIFYTGITTLTGNNSQVNGNFVHSFRSASTAATTMIGIYNYSGFSTFSNNMIRLGVDSGAATTTNPTTMYGLYHATSTQTYTYNNTILIAGTPATGSAQTAALYVATTTPVGQVMDIRNNIFMNTVNNSGTASGKNYGLRLIDSLRVVSNFNLYHVTGTGGIVSGTNYADYTSLGGAANSWKAVTGLDMHSAAGDPNLNANAMGTSDVVSLGVQGTTPVEKSGDPTVTSVTTDFYGNTRSSNTPNDIGAHAGNFNQSPDLFPPVINFTPLTPSGTLSGTRTFSGVNITDNNGIPMVGANRPKVYYSKDGSTWYSSSSTSITGTATSATATFGLDYTPMLPLTTADTIRYFVIAQDNSGNTLSNAPFAVATGVSSITSNPVNPGRYNFLPVIAANSVFQVGAGQTYTTLTGAGGFFEFINSRTLGGHVTAEITSDITNEPGTVALNQFGEDGSGAGTYTLTIRPASGTVSPRTIEGNASNGMIVLNGTQRLKITGVPTGGSASDKMLRFRNQANAATIRLNGATASRVHNCLIEGGPTNTATGVVHISVPSGGTVPSSFDTISNCVITNNTTATLPAGLPVYGIYTNGLSTGSGVFNHSNVISGNEISNFTAIGFLMDVYNGSNWQITGNSFFNNLGFTPNNVGTTMSGINMFPGANSSGNIISDNYIGGSAPNCGGSAWTNGSGNTLYGIRSNVGQGATTMIQNNVVKNINWTATGTTAFYGIIADLGNVMIGGSVATGNVIGDATANNSIVFAHYSSTHAGIIYQGTNNVSVIGNTVAGLTLGSVGLTGGAFDGIRVTSGAVGSVSNNTIGSPSVSNSIVINGNTTMNGITVSPSAVYTTSYTLSNNTVSNLYAPGALTSVFVRGIYVSNNASPTVSNNTVYNLSTNSSASGQVSTGVAIAGITSTVSANTQCYFNNNTVYGIRALNTGNVNAQVKGIQLSGGQNTVVNGNRVYDLTNASTSANFGNASTPCAVGIDVNSTGGINNYITNNQVSLGTGETSNTQFVGLWLQYASTGFTMNAFNNSIYIGGTAGGGTNQSTFAFARGNNSGSEVATYMSLRNNIFVNVRTGGSGKHYSIANQANSPTNTYWNGNSSQYNLLVNATPSTLGAWGLSDQTYSGWLTASQSDAWSYWMQSGASAGQLNLANFFTAPATGNLGLNGTNAEAWYAYGKGISGSAVNNLNADFNGTSRTTTAGSPITIGSVQLNTAPSAAPPAATASAAPAASTTTSYTFGGRNVASIQWGASAPTSISVLNFTGVSPVNAPAGNNAASYVRADVTGGTTPYNYGVTLNYDPAMFGSISSASNLKVSKDNTGSTLGSPAWTTIPVSSVNTSASTVSAASLSSSNANLLFTATENNAPPTFTGFNPTAREVGGTVSIYGRLFTGATALSFNGTSQPTFTVVNDTTITTTVPSGATTGTVSVTNPYGTGTSSASFTVIPAPTLTSTSVSTGTIGAAVTLTGTGFTWATSVKFNSTSASFVIVNNTTITTTVPVGATTGNITVDNPAGTATSGSTFTVIGAPTVTSFTPTSATVGTSISITGTNYQAVTNVKFNGVDASYTVNSSTNISVIVPVGATTGTVSVTNGSGTGTSGSNFTVLTPPTITGFTPSSGGIGTQIVITGTNFTGATAVTVNSTAATFTVNSATQITATVASGTTTGNIVVTTPSGSANSGSAFTVISDLTVSTTTGVSGTYNNVTITSTGNATLTGNLIALGNVVVQGGGKLAASGYTLSGNNGFTLNSGATITIASPGGITATGGLSGDIQVSGTRSYSSGATYVYAGSAAQATGNGLPSSVDSVVISNGNGVTLTSPATINHKLTMGNGNLMLGSSSLTIASTASIIGTSSTSYIVTQDNPSSGGSLRRTVANNATNVLFPIGEATMYTPAQLQLTGASATDVFAVRVFTGVLSGGTSGTSITSNAVNRSWIVTEAVAGGSSATLTVQWDASLELSGFNRSQCGLPKHNGTTWIAAPAYAAATGTNPYTRSLSGITSFSTFTVGDNNSVGALPVNLVSFDGLRIGEDVLVSWQTASETNNSHFEIERSSNGIDFEYIGRTDGAGNSTVVNSYNFRDGGVMSLGLPVYYYRLRQVDFDGRAAYHGPVAVKADAAKAGFNLGAAPNPFGSNLAIQVSTGQGGTLEVTLYDIQGKAAAVKTVVIGKGATTVHMDGMDQLKDGIYLLNATLNGEVYRQKVVKSAN